MKRYIYKFLLLLVLSFSSCTDDVLDLSPESAVTAENFFATDGDFRLFSNQFYDYFPREGRGFSDFIWKADNNSDNQIQNENGNVFAFGANTIADAPPTYDGGGWDFSNIRAVNFFLDHVETSDLAESSKDSWRAEGRFFRAYLYFDKVRKFGDVQWFDKALAETDPEVYKPRDARGVVIGKILEDLDFAIANLPQNVGNKEYIDRFAALALKARITLFEGTFRKYHGLSESANDLLNQAAQACGIIMNEGGYSLHADGGPSMSYYNYFSMVKPGTSNETILARHFDSSFGVSHWSQRFITGQAQTGFSKSLADDYLCLDGLPIALSPLFDVNTDFDYIEVEMGNRDPRMAQSIWNKGDLRFASPDEFVDAPRLDNSFPSGYNIKKFSNSDRALQVPDNAADGVHLFRLGEILLIYAEAKAELGTITQGDLDMSINVLRDRVGMAHMVIANLQRDPDSNFDGSINGVPAVSILIDEIRRERRVELAAEGMRRDDIMRWKAGQLLAQTALGAKFNPLVYPNVQPDDPFAKTNAEGFLEPYQGSALIRSFDENKNYLYPIPPSDIGKYPSGGLSQNPGWE